MGILGLLLIKEPPRRVGPSNDNIMTENDDDEDEDDKKSGCF